MTPTTYAKYASASRMASADLDAELAKRGALLASVDRLIREQVSPEVSAVDLKLCLGGVHDAIMDAWHDTIEGLQIAAEEGRYAEEEF